MLVAWVVCAIGSPVAAPTPPPGQTKAADSNYIIGPGDTLDVFVWRNPELSVTVPVRPDGKISTPLVEDMIAVGKTAPQLARDMEKVLSEYVQSPKINISVKNAASAFSLVKVVGQVAHPQEIPYREGMTVLDAILAAGGLTQFASGTVLAAGGFNEQLKPGDVLVVAQTGIWITRPNEYPQPFHLPLLCRENLIEVAGNQASSQKCPGVIQVGNGSSAHLPSTE